MSYNSNLPEDNTADIRENFRALKEDKIVDAATAVSADTAAKLTTARTIALQGDAIGSTVFDGSADVAIKVAVKGGNADTVGGKSVTDIISACSIYAVPEGAVEYFARSSAPDGWLKADGSAVSRANYAKLFAAIGTMFGKGDGSTTFNLPDLRGEFVRGFDDARGVDGGRALGSRQDDAFKSHSHNYKVADHSNQVIQNWDGSGGLAAFGTDDSFSFRNSGYMSNSGGSETRPRNVALLACIKY
jgi:microcystin-dependent protein